MEAREDAGRLAVRVCEAPTEPRQGLVEAHGPGWLLVFRGPAGDRGGRGEGSKGRSIPEVRYPVPTYLGPRGPVSLISLGVARG